ncbi:MAG: transcriptional repressor [Chloroflexi bacterium]|nr:transcriptional repressor [Chloroflexota bacterium]
MKPAKIPEATKSALRAGGLRLTPQRALILQILKKDQMHLDAESIWQQARREDASLNLATVYRNIRTLVEAGLAQQSFLGEGQKRAFYEWVDKPEHYHFACLRCGAVLELPGERLAAARQMVELEHGLRVLAVHLKLEGICRECLEKASPSLE